MDGNNLRKTSYATEHSTTTYLCIWKTFGVINTKTRTMPSIINIITQF